MTLIENAKSMIPYLQVLCDAEDAVKSGENPPETMTGDTLTAHLTSCRNIALAHEDGSWQARFMGTLTTEPVTDKAELMARQITDEGSQMLIDARNDLRSRALALTNNV